MDSFFKAAVCELDKLLDDFEQNEEEPGRAAAEVPSFSPASLDSSGRHFVPLTPLNVLTPTGGAVETIGEALPNEPEAPEPPQRETEEAFLQKGGSLECDFAVCHTVGEVPDLAEEAGGGSADEEASVLGCGAQLDHQGAPVQDETAILSSGPAWDPPVSVVGPAEMEEAGRVGGDCSCLAGDAFSPMFQVQRTFSVDDAVSHLTCRWPVSDPYRGMAQSLSGTLPWVASLSHASTTSTIPESPKEEAQSCPPTVCSEPRPDVPEDFLPESEQAPTSVTDEDLDTFLKEQGEGSGRNVEKHADEGFSEMNGDSEGGPDLSLGYEGEERREPGYSNRHGNFSLYDTEPSPTAVDDEDSYFSSPSLDRSPCEGDLAGGSIYEEGSPRSLDHGAGCRPHFGVTRPKQLWFEFQSPNNPVAEGRTENKLAIPTGQISTNHIHAPPPAPTVGKDISTLPAIGSGHSHPKSYENSSGCEQLSKSTPHPCSSSSPSRCTPEESAHPGRERRGRRRLGLKQPSWVPDWEAPSCMHCLQRFTFTRRRHHCRACGKVYCAICCNRKWRLKYLERDARVCLTCYRVLHKERTMSPRGLSPNPAVPPLQQALNSTPPAVMMPVSVLKHPGNEAFPREQRQVWFADGLLPNGEVADTTRLSAGGKRSATDSGSVTTEPPVAKGTSRAQGKGPQGDGPSGGPGEVPGGQAAVELPPVSGPWDYSLLCRVAGCVERSSSLLPEEEDGLPPLLFITEEDQGEDVLVHERPSPSQILRLLEEERPRPLTFVLNANLLVNVMLVTYCDGKCWCFSSNGLRGVGQQELVFILQRLPGEGAVPRDIFSLYIRTYQDAERGRFVEDLGSVTLEGNFLGSRDHGGFLFFSPTHQPLGGLSLPPPPFLCGVLIHRLEVPWAKVFPLRLQLRLGAEYSVYPSPLVSVRSRKAVYRESGHTIMNLLADLRNFQYSLPVVEGLQVHMEMGNSYILIPKASFTQMLKVVNSSNEHVISVGASFSPEADSHLVCLQNDDGNYQTQANGMLGRARTVTGASFVVFNGALKASSGFIAKSSIVEDGLMVQITPDTMESLRQALREQRDFQIPCGRADSMETRENINVRWVDLQLPCNAGMISPVDGRSLEEALRVRMEHNAEFQKDGKTIKCTEVFYLPKAPGCPVSAPPALLCRLQQDIATATCAALCPSLTALKEHGINYLGLRVASDSDMVEYQAGSGGRVLPQRYMNHLDGALIPVIHGGSSSIPPQPSDMELLFYITQTI